jgi:hypothetical protein
MSAALAGAGQECPVCRSPDRDTAVCPHCGWELRGGYVAGHPSSSDERALADRLAVQCQRHDLRAAARASGSGSGRDLELLSRLARLARGGAPSAAAIRAAIAEVDSDEPPMATARAGMGFALTRLVAEETDAIAFIEIAPDGVSVETLVVDDLHVPVRKPGGTSLGWASVLPVLPADAGLRWLRLAGGIGISAEMPPEANLIPAMAGAGGPHDMAGRPPSPADPAILAAAVEESMPHVLTRLMAAAAAGLRPGHRTPADSGSGRTGAPPRVDTVLVRRTQHWPLLELAEARVRVALRPVAEIAAPLAAGTLADLAGEAACRAPLRYAYDLILVAVDPDSGVVRPDPYPLFAAGTVVRPHHRQTSTVAVMAPARAASKLALPIVARRGTDLTAQPLIQMAAIDGTAVGPTRLQVRLNGPGQLSVRGRPGLLPRAGDVPGWPGSVTSLPPRLLRTLAVDLILLVELGGAPAAVAARVRLARGLASTLAGAPDARIAVIGYRDHFGRHRIDAAPPDPEALVVGSGMASGAALSSTLNKSAWWQAVPVNDDHAAPLEDALQLVGHHEWAWRSGARHVLLVLGSRPPHPPQADPLGSVTQPCPHRFSWWNTLAQLRRDQAVECLAVLDRPTAGAPASSYAANAWKQLGAEGRFTAGSTTVEHLAQVVGTASSAGAARLSLAARASVTSPRGRGEDSR